jgi:hypothetical protein
LGYKLINYYNYYNNCEYEKEVAFKPLLLPYYLSVQITL